jgi:hypothetical protein
MATKNTKRHKKEEKQENKGGKTRSGPLLLSLVVSLLFCDFLCFLWLFSFARPF